MTPRGTTNPEPRRLWFGLRSQPKHEHIAAGHLQRLEDVEVFLPRIRFRRKTRRGAVWVTEALFPNYLFARFDWRTSFRKVHHAPGVSGVIHFGGRWPTIPDDVIDDLRAMFGQQQLHIISPEMRPGDEVQIAGGVFHGLRAILTQIMPGRERGLVLLDFLGRQTAVEVAVGSLVKEDDERWRVL